MLSKKTSRLQVTAIPCRLLPRSPARLETPTRMAVLATIPSGKALNELLSQWRVATTTKGRWEGPRSLLPTYIPPRSDGKLLKLRADSRAPPMLNCLLMLRPWPLQVALGVPSILTVPAGGNICSLLSFILPTRIPALQQHEEGQHEDRPHEHRSRERPSGIGPFPSSAGAPLWLLHHA